MNRNQLLDEILAIIVPGMTTMLTPEQKCSKFDRIMWKLEDSQSEKRRSVETMEFFGASRVDIEAAIEEDPFIVPK